MEMDYGVEIIFYDPILIQRMEDFTCELRLCLDLQPERLMIEWLLSQLLQHEHVILIIPQKISREKLLASFSEK